MPADKPRSALNEAGQTYTQTIGEHLIQVSFNPSKNHDVARFKKSIADLIDYIIAVNGDPRTQAICITELESAAMWGVKSMTKPARK